jgi:hypothetical protein
MDDNNQPNTPQPAEDTDLAKQYQEILDNYSKELAKNPPVPAPEAAPVAPPEPEPTADIPLTEVPPAPPISNPEPVEGPLPPPAPEIPTVSQPKPTSSGGFFKFLFFISLIIFLGVCGAILFTVISSKQNSVSTITPTPVAIPTVISKVCQLNDQSYLVGQSFTAADGCNTCTCNSDLTIACTTLACVATPTASISAIPKTWKTFTNQTYQYSIRYPSIFTIPAQTTKEISQIGKDIQYCLTDKTGVCNDTIFVYPNSQKLSLTDFVKSNGTLNSSIWNNYSNINGNLSMVDSTGKNFLIYHQDVIVEISFTTFDATTSQILSTLKFTP